MAGKMTREAFAKVEYGGDPPILLIADTDLGKADWRRSAALAGCRLADAVAIGDAFERLDRQAVAAAVVVDVRRNHGHALQRLLDRLDHGAEAGRHNSILAYPPGLLGPLSRGAPYPSIVKLCRPDALRRVEALAAANLRPSQRLNDVGKGQGSGQLQRLSEEVGRIASILARLSEDEAVAEAPAAVDENTEEGLTAAMVRSVIRARRLRDHYFQSELFADPAWDMLLDLMAARLDRQRVAVSSLCIAAAVPPTTALRWIKTLTEQGLFVRTADPHDGRRVFIELSDKAAAQLAAYLKAVQRLSPLAI